MKRRDFQQDARAWKCCWFLFVLKWRVLFLGGEKKLSEKYSICRYFFRESPELWKVQVKKEKSAYNNFVYNDWTTINPQATVQTRCLQSVHPLPSPARHELRPEERWRGKPLPHLTQLRQQETEPITTAERLQQLERASPEWWWQKWRVSLLEVQGVKVLALKKSLEERQLSRN